MILLIQKYVKLNLCQNDTYLIIYIYLLNLYINCVYNNSFLILLLLEFINLLYNNKLKF